MILTSFINFLIFLTFENHLHRVQASHYCKLVCKISIPSLDSVTCNMTDNIHSHPWNTRYIKTWHWYQIKQFSDRVIYRFISMYQKTCPFTNEDFGQSYPELHVYSRITYIFIYTGTCIRRYFYDTLRYLEHVYQCIKSHALL